MILHVTHVSAWLIVITVSYRKEEKMAITSRMPRDMVITILRHRGYTELRTTQGVKPLEECPEYQLWAVYRADKVIKKTKEVNKS